jgi:hypothetical protein
MQGERARGKDCAVPDHPKQQRGTSLHVVANTRLKVVGRHRNGLGEYEA